MVSVGPKRHRIRSGGEGLIMQVSADGGAPEVIARAKPGDMVSGPEVLPGGRFVLFSVTAAADLVTVVDRWDKGRIVVHSLESGEERTLIERGSDAPLPADRAPGVRDGERVVRRSIQRYARAARRSPRPRVERRPARDSGYRQRALRTVKSRNAGVCSRRRRRECDHGPRTVRSVGQGTRLKLPLGAYSGPRISPDGGRLAFTVAAGQEETLACVELAGTKAMRRLTLGGRNRFPVWASNGSRVAYQSNREGDVSLFWQPVDGAVRQNG